MSYASLFEMDADVLSAVGRNRAWRYAEVKFQRVVGKNSNLDQIHGEWRT
jgi:hypothetical protein